MVLTSDRKHTVSLPYDLLCILSDILSFPSNDYPFQMWLPRLMRAADEQEQASSWTRVDRFVRTEPAPHHRQFGPCHCNLPPRRHAPPSQRRPPPAGLFGTDFERSAAILEEVRNGWRLAFFKWLAIVLLVVLLIFIGRFS